MNHIKRTLFLPPPPLEFLSDWFYNSSNIPLSLFIHSGLPGSNVVLYAAVLNLYPELWWFCIFCILAFLSYSYTKPQTVLLPTTGFGCSTKSLLPMSSLVEILWIISLLLPWPQDYKANKANYHYKANKEFKLCSMIAFFHITHFVYNSQFSIFYIRDMKSWCI